MAAKIGILGESTIVTVANTTLYTVPADKAARVRILLLLEAHATDNMNIQVRIGSPGNENTWHITAATNGTDVFTGSLRDGTNFMQLSTIGIVEEIGLTFVPGNNENYLATTLAVDYWLSTGDTVKLENEGGQSVTDLLCQVQGVEDDA